MKRLVTIREDGTEVWAELYPDPIAEMLADPALPPPVSAEQVAATAEGVRAALALQHGEWVRWGYGPDAGSAHVDAAVTRIDLHAGEPFEVEFDLPAVDPHCDPPPREYGRLTGWGWRILWANQATDWQLAESEEDAREQARAWIDRANNPTDRARSAVFVLAEPEPAGERQDCGWCGSDASQGEHGPGKCSRGLGEMGRYLG